MKKILFGNIMCAIFLVVCIINAGAENVNSLTEKLDELIMERHFTEEQLSRMDEEYLKDFDKWFWDEYLPSTKLLGKMRTNSDEAEYEYCLNMNRPDYCYGVLMTYLDTSKYAKQYAENKVFYYLFDDTKQYWAVLHKRGHGVAAEFRKDGSLINDMASEMGKNYDTVTITQELIDFLKNPQGIKTQLLAQNETVVTDLKLFSMKNGITFLYIRCNSNEYMIKLYGFTGYCEYIPEIEENKLYPVIDVLNAMTIQDGEDLPSRFDLSQNIPKIKTIYNTEAQRLQAEGLLKGNENGLDLLKPLTRIEAATILVRAMGYEDATTSEESYFNDIKSDNWGAKYANIAKDKGIANGVGDNCFAPDEKITASQFATLILRNIGESPDWQTAITTFIERGLISSEQAETMDFFTRGDMAKIIYEAKLKGIL